jgi:hypothetical protein
VEGEERGKPTDQGLRDVKGATNMSRLVGEAYRGSVCSSPASVCVSWGSRSVCDGLVVML